MNKPNLFLAGAPKSGTSFLFQTLNSHPVLFFPKIKELNHFSYQDILDLNSYYKDFKIEDRKKYLSFYRKAKDCKYLVDSSVSYFTFPEVPGKIKAFNAESKVIFILRNPIKRAYSHYLMDVRMGYAKKSFGEYIRGKNEYPVHYHQYVGNSLYANCIGNYLDVFGKENSCVLLLENIETDMTKLCDFLEISKEVIKIETSKKVNQNKKPKNIISKTLQKNRKLTSYLKMVIPRSFSKRFNGLMYKKEERKDLDAADRNYLLQLFREDVKELSDLFEIDFNAYWKI